MVLLHFPVRLFLTLWNLVYMSVYVGLNNLRMHLSVQGNSLARTPWDVQQRRMNLLLPV